MARSLGHFAGHWLSNSARHQKRDTKTRSWRWEWDSKPAKLRQKNRDARWTKKHGKSFFGYKNHVNADAKHKLIRRYEVTDAAVHDSQKLDRLLNKGNTAAEVFADSAYRSTKIEAQLRASGFKSRIHQRAARNHPLSDAQAKANRNRSKIRARVERVFGAQETSPGGRVVRTIGIVQARAEIGLQPHEDGVRSNVRQRASRQAQSAHMP